MTMPDTYDGIPHISESIEKPTEKRIKDLLNQPITLIKKTDEFPSDFGPRTVYELQAQHNNQTITFTTSSKIIKQQYNDLQKTKSLPYQCKIIKKPTKAGNTCYTLKPLTILERKNLVDSNEQPETN